MLLRKQAVKWYFIFPPHLTIVLLHYLGKQKTEDCIFLLKFWELYCQQTQKTFILSLGHSWTALCSHKNQPYAPNKTSEASIACYIICYHTLIVHQVCGDVDRCVKSGSCSLSSLKWKVNGQYWWNILLSQEKLAVIKRCVDNNIICLTATQLMHAPVHDVRNTVQQLLHKTPSFILLSYRPQQARAELCIYISYFFFLQLSFLKN